MKIVMKLHKQRMETYQIYQEQNREDLAADELFQAKVIEAYMPQMMSDEEVQAEVDQAIATTGATSPQDMGKVMGAASKQLAGLADGKAISAKVSELLKK